MNCKQANSIDIADFLTAGGHKLQQVANGEFWCCSPFRDEKTPSFHINPKRNIWYDHGEGIGGKLVDLVMRIQGTDTAGALAYIERSCGPAGTSFSFHPQSSAVTTQEAKSVEVVKVVPLVNQALINYCEGRCIPGQLAAKFLQECYFKAPNGKTYFALALPNDGGGYELRNVYFQGCAGRKTVTTLTAGADRGNAIAVFEGVFDLLSAMVYFNRSELATDALILNSVALVGEALPVLRQYPNVNLFLDNDRAGQDAVRTILLAIPYAVDHSGIYATAKDFNELITKQKNDNKE